MVAGDHHQGWQTAPPRWIQKAMQMPQQVLHGSVSKPCTPGEHQNSW